MNTFGGGDVETFDSSNKKELNATSSSFDGREYDKTTSVKDQGRSTLCGSFATIAAVEHNLLIKEVEKQKDSLDLDEDSFAYHARSRSEEADPLGNTKDDLRETAGWRSGFSAREASYTLLQGNNLQDQKSNFKNYNHDSKFKTTDIIGLDQANRNEVKEAVLKYGAVVFSYVGYNDNSNTKYFNNPSGFLNVKTNKKLYGHASVIVGWDDNIEIDKFNEKPKEKGAGLIKNSGGDKGGDNGYFGLSYETPLRRAFSVNVEGKNKYDFNYYYDGFFGDISLKNINKAAVLFRAQKGGENQVEVLKAINVGLKGAKGGKLTVKVYKNLDYNFQTLEAKQQAIFKRIYEIKNDGLISFELKEEGKNEGIELDKNKSFAIEVEIEGTGGEIVFGYEPHSANDFSYYYDGSSGKNSLVEYGTAARIKAGTKLKTRTTTSEVKDLGNADVILKKNTFRGGEEIDTPIIEYDGITLKKDQDYTLKTTERFDKEREYYYDDDVLNGNGLFTITGIGEYSGQIQIPYFYKAGLRPNFKLLGKKLNLYRNFAEGKEGSLDSNGELVREGTYLNYIGEDKNHYIDTSFSISEVKEFLKEDGAEEEIVKVIELENKESITSMTKVMQVKASTETTNTPAIAAEKQAAISDNTVSTVNPENKGNGTITILAAGGGSAAMGLFALMSLWLKKRFF